MRRAVQKLLTKIGAKEEPYPPDLDEAAVAIIEAVRPFTMVNYERIFALIKAVRYAEKHALPGAFVECGVWKGGCMMAVAQALQASGSSDRHLYLFDTFSGMPKPDAVDTKFTGSDGTKTFERLKTGDDASDWCLATQAEVAENLTSTGYPADRIHLVPGKVEDTLPAGAPEEIALLRLDTDFYASTKHELEHLYPRLCPGGVLLIDDYGTWKGARQAVDEYLEAHRIPMLLTRVARSVVGVKPRT